MNFTKKGELSINVVVVSAIALIVLVVLTYLIFGVPKDINKAKKCESINNGVCAPATCDTLDSSNEEQYILNPQGICAQGEVCCIKTV